MKPNSVTVPLAFQPKKFSLAGIVIFVAMTICLLYFVIPLWWLVVSVTKSLGELFHSFGLWFGKDFSLVGNIQSLSTTDSGNYYIWIKNTIIYSITASFGSSLISALAGYAFSQYRFFGRDKLFAVVIAAVFIPVTVFAVPLYLLIAKTGLNGSLLGIILPALVNPFGVYLMRIYADQAIPPDIVDSARIDGASELRIFVLIVFRLLAPGFVTILLFAFVNAWNNYFLPLLVLNSPNTYPLTVGLDYWNALSQVQSASGPLYPQIITGSVLGIAPVLVLFLFLQRYWQRGLALGSVKG